MADQNNQPAPAPVVWITNAYLGDINPGTSEGAKLFNKATSTPDSLLTINQKNARDIYATFELDASDFGWGPLVGRVSVTGGVNPQRKSILTEANEITLEHVQKQARRTWGTPVAFRNALPEDFEVEEIDPAGDEADRPTFYRRTRSLMIAKRILSSLDPASKKVLMMKKKDFQWIEDDGTINNDGPTMLWLILLRIKPSVC